jgi:hypothetical protein
LRWEADVQHIDANRRPALFLWFHELMRGPVTAYGDYFDRLRGSIESSAPIADPRGYPCI